jgi:hypothetical protein
MEAKCEDGTDGMSVGPCTSASDMITEEELDFMGNKAFSHGLKPLILCGSSVAAECLHYNYLNKY